jgi:hypothetical protein
MTDSLTTLTNLNRIILAQTEKETKTVTEKFSKHKTLKTGPNQTTDLGPVIGPDPEVITTEVTDLTHETDQDLYREIVPKANITMTMTKGIPRTEKSPILATITIETETTHTNRTMKKLLGHPNIKKSVIQTTPKKIDHLLEREAVEDTGPILGNLNNIENFPTADQKKEHNLPLKRDS